MSVVVENLTKRFENFVAVDRCTFSVAEGTFFSLLGPSGCGKTTLLRLIGGFEQASEGRISIFGEDVTNVSPQKRPTAMVFQNYALFPNMTIEENVRYGLDIRKLSAADKREKVQTALKRVQLDGIASKSVTQLSGGQQQRVALARAMALEPRVLLFDEPLSNLDVALREQARYEIKQLQREAGTTAIYVTHDQQEALALSDQVVVLNQGKMQQIGTPREVYFAPANAFVAQFIGASNLIDSPVLLETWMGSEIRKEARLVVKPEHWEVTESAEFPLFEVIDQQFLGAHIAYQLQETASQESQKIQIHALFPANISLNGSCRLKPKEWYWIPTTEI
jgi:ABC-type Fe3+/spermidine/putrescine transport system ATPase subunit